MAGVYRPRHPERTVLYRVLFHHFERFLAEYEGRFEKEHGYFRPIVFTIPKMLRVFFKYKRRLLGDLCRCALRALAGYFELLTETTITPGVIAAIQTFGDRINFPPHLHFLVTEGGVDEADVFHKIPRIDDSRLAEIFAQEVLAMLVRKELLSPEWAERILSWRHTGFNVHSLVRAKTKPEAKRVKGRAFGSPLARDLYPRASTAEVDPRAKPGAPAAVGKYMIRPLLALEWLTFLEPEGKVGYRRSPDSAEQETMDYLEFIARVTSHIPDKGQVMVRYYGLYANAHRGKVKKHCPSTLRVVKNDLKRIPSKGWAEMIRKVYEVDPMVCPQCGGRMKVVAFITEYIVVDRIIDHLKLRFIAEKPPAAQIFTEVALIAGGVFLAAGDFEREEVHRFWRDFVAAGTAGSAG